MSNFDEYTITYFLESLQNEFKEVITKLKKEEDKNKKKELGKYLDSLSDTQSKLVKLLQQKQLIT